MFTVSLPPVTLAGSSTTEADEYSSIWISANVALCSVQKDQPLSHRF